MKTMKLSQKGFAVLMPLLIAVAVALAGAGVYVYVTQVAKPKLTAVVKNSQDDVKQTKNPATTAPENENEADQIQSTIDETSGWQTYQNDNCGYMIRYPNDFRPDEYSSNANINIDVQFGEIIIECKPLSVFLDSGFDSLQDYVSNRIKNDAVSTNFGIKTIKIGNSLGIEDKVRNQDGTYSNEIYIQGGNNVIYGGDSVIIFGPPNESDIENTKIFNQMLSTFRFIAPQAD